MSGAAIVASAQRDIAVSAVTERREGEVSGRSGSNVYHDTLADEKVVGSALQASGDVTLVAGNDLALIASAVSSTAGAVDIGAGNDLVVAGQGEAHSRTHESANKRFGSRSSESDAVADELYRGSAVSGKTVALSAGQDARVVGSAVSADEALKLTAGRDVVIDSGQETHTESHMRQSSRSWGKLLSIAELASGDVGMPASIGLRSVLPGDSNKQSRWSGTSTTSVSSVLSGATITSTSGRDTQVGGSVLVADGDLGLVAGRDLSVVSVQSTQANQSQTSSHATGNVGKWWQPAFGSAKQSTQAQSGSTTQVSSQIASLGGDVNLTAGNAYTQVASDVLAMQGDIDIGSRKIDIVSGVNSQSVSESQQSRKIAIGGSVSVPFVDAAK